jgi:hypothetical protein
MLPGSRRCNTGTLTMMRSEQTAPCPAEALALSDNQWDTRPEFVSGESEALDTLVGHFRQGGKNWPPFVLTRLSRLLTIA